MSSQSPHYSRKPSTASDFPLFERRRSRERRTSALNECSQGIDGQRHEHINRLFEVQQNHIDLHGFHEPTEQKRSGREEKRHPIAGARPSDAERVCNEPSGHRDRRRSPLLWLRPVSEGTNVNCQKALLLNCLKKQVSLHKLIGGVSK